MAKAKPDDINPDATSTDLDRGADDGASEGRNSDAPKQAAPRARQQLLNHEIQPVGIHWSNWSVLTKENHTIEDVLDAGYLFSKHEHMRPNDYVEIKHPLGFFAVCLDIVRIDKQARGIVANVRHIFDYTSDDNVMVRPRLDSVRIDILGDRGWSVIDGIHVVADGFTNRVEAEKWLAKRKAGD